MNARAERGIAMVLALFLMSAMSVLAASMMFLSQTETYATLNYRMMSQARYAAEAGVQRAANFLLDTSQYALPTVPTGGTDSVTDSYDLTTSPVKCKAGASACTAGQDIKLSSTVSASNYPDTTKKNSFAAVAAGTLAAGNTTLSYTTTATLLTMQYFDSYDGTAVVQTWRVESVGRVNGTRNATVEVMALVERPKVPASGYAAFATSDTCGALTFAGHVSVDSYDSTGMSGSASPSYATSGGNVGTNGNLTLSGGADVAGNLYTPRTGVGACNESSATAFTGAVDADSNPVHVDSIVQLPAVVQYPDPLMPGYSTAAPASFQTSGEMDTACATLGLTAPACQITGGSGGVPKTLQLDATTGDITVPSLTINGNFRLKLVAGAPNKYNMNSLTLAGGADIQISATTSNSSAVVNIIGKDQTGTDLANPLNMEGGSNAEPECTGCSNYDASLLRFVYAGEGEIDLIGNSDMVGSVYAPNAYVKMGGNYALYGSVIAGTMNSTTGSPIIHYDRRLTREIFMAGNPAAGTFTWKRAS